MAEVKGKFITMVGEKMRQGTSDNLDDANAMLESHIGLTYDELDPEGWYDTELFGKFMKMYAEGSIAGREAIRIAGKQVYPTIKYTTGLPDHVTSVYDLILFEADGFEQNHRGSDVVPRNFLRKKEGDVIVEADAPGYDCKLFEGVYEGLFVLFDESGDVEHSECTKHGADRCKFRITW
ncbi:hypothetical protein ACFOZ7_03515 [Natribaculum luteum]|uniref:4-vinyl reductase 4VR domain-containing protein n=1 Tax=Natribaculum luteum TaxID=1586232 RepID=A0ABD5NVH1_9EURY|nr:hypothetical protein [Natribaculum luteum]